MTDSDRYATEAWMRAVERESPKLVGMIGRPPTMEECELWMKGSEKSKDALILARMRYLRSGLKTHMLAYLKLRQECGYIDGVATPRWLLTAGKT